MTYAQKLLLREKREERRLACPWAVHIGPWLHVLLSASPLPREWRKRQPNDKR